MREVPGKEAYPPEQVQSLEILERRIVRSDLTGPEGEHAELNIAIAADGKARRVNLVDLDETVVFSTPVHFKAVDQIFPEVADKEEMHDVYFRGFRLGNSYREWDRMWRIYREGQVQYKDRDTYYREWVADPAKRRLLDEAGHPEGLHERAAEILMRYGPIAAAYMKELYAERPEEIRKMINEPIYHLLAAKARLGEAIAFMTANQDDFAKALITYTGLWRYGYALATDEDMARTKGGKEKVIPGLIARLEEKGIAAPNDRLVVMGDSIMGDIGSGAKVAWDSGRKFQGVLVHRSQEELEAFKAAAARDPEIRRIVEEVEMTNVVSADVRRNEQGMPLMGRQGSIQRETPG